MLMRSPGVEIQETAEAFASQDVPCHFTDPILVAQEEFLILVSNNFPCRS